MSTQRLIDLLSLREADNEWRRDAACIGQNDLFFVDRGHTTGPAKRLCAMCSVTQACLDYAITTRASDGIWGGLTYNERRNHIRKHRRKAS